MIGLSITRNRNNAKQLVRNVKKNKLKLLNQFGEDVHQIAKASMQRVTPDSENTSRPYSPPFIRSAEPNLTTIHKYVDPGARYVVTGPVRNPSPDNLGDPIPGILERGGMVVKRARRNGSRQGRIIRYRVQPRPFIRPAAIQAIVRLRASVKSRGIAR